MRLISLAAILLVCIVFVTCSSHKGRSKTSKNHNRKHLSSSGNISSSSSSSGSSSSMGSSSGSSSSSSSTPNNMDIRNWNLQAKSPSKDLTPSSRNSNTSKSKKENPMKRPPKKKKQEWSQRHRRKHWALLELAETDRLLHRHLVPESAPFDIDETPQSLQCCPTLVETVQPRGGVNLNGHVVKLYQDSETTQKLYELSCRPDVLNKPCRFIEKNLRPLSRCTQKYSYSYALVTDHTSATDWRLDYIRLRSGCACEIYPPASLDEAEPDDSMLNVTNLPVR